MRNTAKSNLALLLIAASLFGGSSNAFASDDNPTPPPGIGQPHFDDGARDSERKTVLESRYGHDRDIATPPLVVRQSIKNGNLEANSIPMVHHDAQIQRPNQQQPPNISTSIRVAATGSVATEIKPSDFESPIQHFLNQLYFVAAGIFLVLILLTFLVWYRKGKLSK